jgi:hypothetical protein
MQREAGGLKTLRCLGIAMVFAEWPHSVAHGTDGVLRVLSALTFVLDGLER